MEREAFKADESDIMAHPLVRTTEAFLAKHLGLSPGTGTGTAGAVGSTNISKAGKAGMGGKGKVRVDKDVQGAAANVEALSLTDAAAGPTGPIVLEPHVTLLISLSGGKFHFSWWHYG